jgi:hypothetical protein
MSSFDFGFDDVQCGGADAFVQRTLHQHARVFFRVLLSMRELRLVLLLV